MSLSFQRSLSIQSDTEHLHLVRSFVGEAVLQTGFSPEDRNRIVLAVDEAVANVIGHAYEDTPGGPIHVAVDADPTRFRVVIRDRGRPFDPEAIKTPDIRAHVDQGRKNGLGVFLMRKIMDVVAYEFHADENQLTLVKFVR